MAPTNQSNSRLPTGVYAMNGGRLEKLDGSQRIPAPTMPESMRLTGMKPVAHNATAPKDSVNQHGAAPAPHQGGMDWWGIGGMAIVGIGSMLAFGAHPLLAAGLAAVGWFAGRTAKRMFISSDSSPGPTSTVPKPQGDVVPGKALGQTLELPHGGNDHLPNKGPTGRSI